jgi:hypothetical protein
LHEEILGPILAELAIGFLAGGMWISATKLRYKVLSLGIFSARLNGFFTSFVSAYLF